MTEPARLYPVTTAQAHEAGVLTRRLLTLLQNPAGSPVKPEVVILGLTALLPGPSETPEVPFGCAVEEFLYLTLPPEILHRPIEELGLGNWAYNRLKREGIHRLGRLLEYSESDLLAIRMFGIRSLGEVKWALTAQPEAGLHLSRHDQRSLRPPAGDAWVRLASPKRTLLRSHALHYPVTALATWEHGEVDCVTQDLAKFGVVSIKQLLACADADIEGFDWRGHASRCTERRNHMLTPAVALNLLKARLRDCKLALRPPLASLR